MITPIQTRYNGRYFRSRLEARWAVYFDSIGVQYEHEPEGYEVATGTWYLPDLWLPEYEIHAEIKHEGGDFQKAYLFAAEYDIILLEGPPALKSYKLLYHAEQLDGEYRVSWMPICISHAARERWGSSIFFYGEHYHDDLDRIAIEAAMSARFDGNDFANMFDLGLVI